ncbi:MAG: SDR family oxidoreductase [Deltaproteobacteria bacterium]|nr:SDR family oxidoreductase [Deltaproteobacteria bacterium]MBI3389315.1 SDR family oxidoreductase [Deltaproteobacteria bacterium]
MAERLTGKVAVITGAANGIGRGTTLRFLAEGARVIAADLNATTGAEMLELAARAGHRERVRFIKTDVAQEVDVAAAIDLAVSAFGRLDCVFNNAGVVGAIGPIDQLGADDWDYTFAVLVRGVFLGMKHAARVFKRQGGGGAIISTASIAGLSGGDGPQAYSASKAAVINLTRAVAVELAPFKIRVNAICPGGILTPLLHRGSPEMIQSVLEKMQPWPEAGLPEHIAAAALFLASDDAAFVTGEALVVDGGLTAAGGNAMKALGQGELSLQVVGVDRGTTGLESTLRAIE